MVDANIPGTFKLHIESPAKQLDLTIDTALSVRQGMDRSALRVRAACGGIGTCGACAVQTVSGQFSVITLVERQKLSAEELARGMRLACQLRLHSDAVIYCANPAPASEWKSLLPSDHLSWFAADASLTQPVYALAVDLGTTCIRLSLWNKQSGRCIGSRYALNPQLVAGSDVLSRLDAERSGGALQTLSELARNAIIAGVRDILSREVGEITSILAHMGEVLVVGNTAMLSLLCGDNTTALYLPENWDVVVPCQPVAPERWRQEWRMPHALMSIIQPMAGFIGSDLLAAVLASGITAQTQPALLIDFGTNTEMALWDGQRLLIASVPGGPAFEGMGLRNGASAESGAIYRVRKVQGQYVVESIDAAPAKGYCASGFIDAIALLLQDQIIKPSGRFSQTISHYLLDSDNVHSAIYAQDIDAFQRAKGSTAGAIQYLAQYANIKLAALQQIWVCGLFGQHIHAQHAMQVGLLPQVSHERLYLLANASLIGAEMLLMSKTRTAVLEQILQRTQALNLTRIDLFEERFIDNLRLCPLRD